MNEKAGAGTIVLYFGNRKEILILLSIYTSDLYIRDCALLPTVLPSRTNIYY